MDSSVIAHRTPRSRTGPDNSDISSLARREMLVHVYGRVPGQEVGNTYKTRIQLKVIHHPVTYWIHLGPEGPYSLIVQGDKRFLDEGSLIVLSTKDTRRNKPKENNLPPEGFKKGGCIENLCKALKSRHPIRVIRVLRPSVGSSTIYRYDGLYTIMKKFILRGQLHFLLRRNKNQVQLQFNFKHKSSQIRHMLRMKKKFSFKRKVRVKKELVEFKKEKVFCWEQFKHEVVENQASSNDEFWQENSEQFIKGDNSPDVIEEPCLIINNPSDIGDPTLFINNPPDLEDPTLYISNTPHIMEDQTLITSSPTNDIEEESVLIANNDIEEEESALINNSNEGDEGLSLIDITNYNKQIMITDVEDFSDKNVMYEGMDIKGEEDGSANKFDDVDPLHVSDDEEMKNASDSKDDKHCDNKICSVLYDFSCSDKGKGNIKNLYGQLGHYSCLYSLTLGEIFNMITRTTSKSCPCSRTRSAFQVRFESVFAGFMPEKQKSSTCVEESEQERERELENFSPVNSFFDEVETVFTSKQEVKSPRPVKRKIMVNKRKTIKTKRSSPRLHENVRKRLDEEESLVSREEPACTPPYVSPTASIKDDRIFQFSEDLQHGVSSEELSEKRRRKRRKGIETAYLGPVIPPNVDSSPRSRKGRILALGRMFSIAPHHRKPRKSSWAREQSDENEGFKGFEGPFRPPFKLRIISSVLKKIQTS